MKKQDVENVITVILGIGFFIIVCLADRKNRRQAVLSLKDGMEKLKAGYSLIIFPEGTRSAEEDFAEFKTGVLLSNCPAAVDGTYAIMERMTAGALNLQTYMYLYASHS
ncbi:lysophospholipid acyltransferase family protein [Metabacillus dongyingensis]|uniref:lysophospholipid acyltransferase family protein n=1 Tax=Metabacillus dongyingensis TaxID=2874282 RepID=UPI003B8CBF2E